MTFFNPFNILFGRGKIEGSEKSDLIIGSIGNDKINGNEGDDLIVGLLGNDKINAGDGDDKVFAGRGHDTVEGGLGEDSLYGDSGNDTIVGNKGDDQMFGGNGNDKMIWNNGDGSDLMVGGRGRDQTQVNFNTDLVNDDLQNKDVAEFSVTDKGVQFARIELNDQTEQGLFQLDIRETETLETNFGGGDDKAVIVDNVLDEIRLDLDGGAGIDTIDLSRAAEGAKINLKNGRVDNAKAKNFENAIGSEFDDRITGDDQNNEISGLGGSDTIRGHKGDDTLVGGKGDDFVFGGAGDDQLVWNNGDGSDLLKGGQGYDQVQVNFDTDLVDDDLQNKDVAEFSVTKQGVQFARIEVNDQTERGLFQLDIRQTETLETNFGDGDDKAVIVDNVLQKISLDLDGGEGIDLLDLSQASSGITVDLAKGTLGQSKAVNFENVTGTDFDDTIVGDNQDNVIRSGAGSDDLTGGQGADTFLFFAQDEGIDIIRDFEFGVDILAFETSDPSVTTENLMANISQVGGDVELSFNNRVITIEDAAVTDFSADDFMIA